MSPWKANSSDLLPDPATLLKGVEAMSPAQKAIYLRVNDMCMKCHDIDNDPNFKFAQNWPQIIHGKKARAAVPARERTAPSCWPPPRGWRYRRSRSGATRSR